MKKTDSTQNAHRPGESSDYTTVRIDPKIYLAVKLHFKNNEQLKHLRHSHEIMEELCLDYLRNHAPELLKLLQGGEDRQR